VDAEIQREERHGGEGERSAALERGLERRERERGSEGEGQTEAGEKANRRAESPQQGPRGDETVRARVAESERETDQRREGEGEKDGAWEPWPGAEDEGDAGEKEHGCKDTRVARRLGPTRETVDGQEDLVEVGGRKGSDVSRVDSQTAESGRLGKDASRRENGRGAEKRREGRRNSELDDESTPVARSQELHDGEGDESGRRSEETLGARREESEPPRRGGEKDSRAIPPGGDEADTEEEKRKERGHGHGVRPGGAVKGPGREHVRDPAEEWGDAGAREKADEEKASQPGEPDVREGENVRETVDGGARQEQRDGERVEDRSLLMEGERVPHERTVQPERGISGAQVALDLAPDREVLVEEVVREEGSRAGGDRKERRREDGREEQGRQKGLPDRPSLRQRSGGRGAQTKMACAVA